MRNRTKLVVIGASALALAATGGGLAVAGGAGEDVGDSEAPISGGDLDRASDAALEHVGNGQVSGTEVGDEESYYEVEVTREDGSQVDVQLNREFGVVGAEDDDDSKEDEGEGDE